MLQIEMRSFFVGINVANDVTVQKFQDYDQLCCQRKRYDYEKGEYKIWILRVSLCDAAADGLFGNGYERLLHYTPIHYRRGEAQHAAADRQLGQYVRSGLRG